MGGRGGKAVPSVVADATARRVPRLSMGGILSKIVALCYATLSRVDLFTRFRTTRWNKFPWLQLFHEIVTHFYIFLTRKNNIFLDLCYNTHDVLPSDSPAPGKEQSVNHKKSQTAKSKHTQARINTGFITFSRTSSWFFQNKSNTYSSTREFPQSISR